MAKHIKLNAAARDKAGKGVSRALRLENSIPAVIYGDHKEPVLISLPAKEVNLEYNKGHMFTSVTDLKVGDEKHMVLARDVQVDPVTDFVLHVDYLRVSAKTKIHVKVPLHFINEEESPGLEHKGILNVVRYEVEIVCPATDIPEALEADLAGAEIGDAIKSTAIKLPKGAVFAIQDREFTLATIVEPRRIIDEEEEGEEAEVAEGEEEAASEEGSEEKAEEAAE
jgi:large subunit ribosomal protein L25